MWNLYNDDEDDNLHQDREDCYPPTKNKQTKKQKT